MKQTSTISFSVKKLRYHFLLIIAFSLFLGACSSVAHKQKSLYVSQQSLPFPGYEQLTDYEQSLADSLIGHALDYEALYSLLGNLKPISSIGLNLSYPLGKDSLQFDGQHAVVDTNKESSQQSLSDLETWYRVLDALSFDNYQFVLLPHKHVWDDAERNMQLLVCRTDLIDELLKTQSSFFGQWGFTPGTDPAVLLTAIEFEEKNDRYRAYGYLFGYPRHAVDFFVEASIKEQKTDEFVKRSFFHIPVHQAESGYFTYALPKDFTPTAKDSLLLQRAKVVLENYRNIRPNYVNEEGKLEAIQLFRDWWQKSN